MKGIYGDKMWKFGVICTVTRNECLLQFALIILFWLTETNRRSKALPWINSYVIVEGSSLNCIWQTLPGIRSFLEKNIGQKISSCSWAERKYSTVKKPPTNITIHMLRDMVKNKKTVLLSDSPLNIWSQLQS